MGEEVEVSNLTVHHNTVASTSEAIKTFIETLIKKSNWCLHSRPNALRVPGKMVGHKASRRCLQPRGGHRDTKVKHSNMKKPTTKYL